MAEAKIRVAGSADVREGALFSTQAQGTKVLMTRINGRVYAVVDRCPHMGMSLAKGRIEGGVVTCPWHNSRFDFCTGRNMDWVSAIMGMPMPKWTHPVIAMGKSPAPLRTLLVEERDGHVWLSL
jgi:nitrite reductase/ring-hydroxylating ferredoxin subunit